MMTLYQSVPLQRSVPDSQNWGLLDTNAGLEPCPLIPFTFTFCCLAILPWMSFKILLYVCNAHANTSNLHSPCTVLDRILQQMTAMKENVRKKNRKIVFEHVRPLNLCCVIRVNSLSTAKSIQLTLTAVVQFRCMQRCTNDSAEIHHRLRDYLSA